MESVDLVFANLQSHEHTKFSLKPGLNFILADDNNVGKSTIFKVLSTLACAPFSNGVKIDRLIRTGTNQAYAAFKYGRKNVVARLYRGTTPGASKVFFEVVESGVITRQDTMPPDLLDALGIVVGENSSAINFNDADSVQLISKSSSESDAIVTYIMQDQRVEKMKRNMVEFSRELYNDERIFTAQADTADGILKGLEYAVHADEFERDIDELEVLCRVLDDNFMDMLALREWSQLGINVDSLKSVMHLLEQLPCSREIVDITRQAVAPSELEETYKLCILSKVFDEAWQTLVTLHESLVLLDNALDELHGIQLKIAEIAETVDCPVRGKVFYTDEKCVSYFDGPALRC